METKRLLELLAYASICFEHCTNPFDGTHLIKKNVSSDECGELSSTIGELCREDVQFYGMHLMGTKDMENLFDEASKEYEETQE